MPVLSIQGLSKRYGPLHAVKDLSLTIESGQIFGLLGPNGSGKTTTLGMILGIIRPNSGHYTWFGGKSEGPVGQRLGVLLETPNFYPHLNADENLGIVRHIKRSNETTFDELLHLVKLDHRRTSRFETYSLGMKQRLAIAAALVGNPDVLLLDEPTNGLDPEGIADVRRTINEIGQSGKTVMLASHILAEVEKTCTHVAILKAGQLLMTGLVGTILSNETVYEVGALNLNALSTQLAKIEEVKEAQLKGAFYEVSLDSEYSIAALNQRLVSAGIDVVHLKTKRHRLEDEFLEIVS